MIEVSGLNRGAFAVIYTALNSTKPKGDEFLENAAFRKVIKDKFGVNKSGGPDIDKLDTPEYGGSVSVAMEDSTFRYVEKVLKWAVDSGEVFSGVDSELVAETLDIFKAAKKA
jgi:hypothetical protein